MAEEETASAAGTGAAAPERAPRRKSLRQMQRDLTRSHIVAAALTTFDRVGFGAATMDDIAEEAQVNRGTLYLHFTNKADILHAALADVRGLRDNYDRAAAARTREEVHRVFEQTIEYWRAEAAGVWRHIADAAAVDAAIRQWQIGYESRQRALQENLLVDRGVPREKASVRAFLMMSMYTEITRQVALEPATADLPGLADALTDVFLLFCTP